MGRGLAFAVRLRPLGDSISSKILPVGGVVLVFLGKRCDKIWESIWHNQVEDRVEQDGVEVGHADEAENCDNDAPEFDFVVLGYAT